MQSITLKANAKINIGLFIKKRRKDGYHEIQSLFYPVDTLFDEIEISTLENANRSSLTSTGISIPGESNQNICLKTWKALKDSYPELPAMHINLKKRIPTGAGLGGGSSDAAAVLLGINRLCNLRMPEDELFKFAVQLGADVSFFLMNKPAYVTGIGNQLKAYDIQEKFSIKLIHTGIHSDTAKAFGELNINQCSTDSDLEQLLSKPIAKWHSYITNDFEKVLFKKYPEIANAKASLYGAGAIYSSMTGSGSTVYGLFTEKNERENG